MLGASSESVTETEAAIWEIPDSGGTWTKSRSVPIDARAVFVSDQTWGYIDRGHPRNVVVFESDAKPALKTSIATDFAVGDTVPLVWLKDDKAVILSLAKAGVWATNDQGVSVNTTPPGEWAIAKISIESGKIATITMGEKPALSPDQKVLAFLRDGELRVRYMDTGRERVTYKPNPLGGGVKSMFWLADSKKLIFNTSTGSELFGLGSRCVELDLATDKTKVMWTADEGCSAAVNPSFVKSASDRH